MSQIAESEFSDSEFTDKNGNFEQKTNSCKSDNDSRTVRPLNLLAC